MPNTIKMNYYQIKVDSAKVSIPYQNCTYISKELTDYFEQYLLNTETSELIKLNKKQVRQPFEIVDAEKGIYFKIFIDSQSVRKGVADLFVSILINSKHLGKDYFKGITIETLPKIYDVLMSLDVVKFDYNELLNARYIDTDLCFDFVSSKDDFLQLKKNILASTLYPLDWNATYLDTNSGIWSCKSPTSKVKPRDLATAKKPYLKFYSKEVDFNTKSKAFADYYNLTKSAENVVRFECNIINAKHKKYLGIESIKTFGQLLNNKDLKSICSSMFKLYFESAKFVKAILTKNNVTKQVLLEAIVMMKKANIPNSEIIKLFDRNDVSRNTKKHWLNLYYELMSNDEIPLDEFDLNQLSNDIFSFFGVNTQTKLNL